MTPGPTADASPETSDDVSDSTPRGSFVLKALPFMALLAWLGAVLVAVLHINPWAPGGSGMAMYGATVPDPVVFALLAVSLACGAIAIWRQALLWSYLCGIFLLPLGTGAKSLVGHTITSGDLLALLAFALAVFLTIEYLSAMERFAAIVASTRGLEGGEARPVARFLLRYLVGSVALGAVYATLLGGWIQLAVPGIAGLFSERIADGIENRTALGIVTFTGLLLLVLFSGRALYDGIAGILQEPDDEGEGDDITDIRSVDVDREVGT